MHDAVALQWKSRLHSHRQLTACAQAHKQHAGWSGGVSRYDVAGWPEQASPALRAGDTCFWGGRGPARAREDVLISTRAGVLMKAAASSTQAAL